MANGSNLERLRFEGVLTGMPPQAYVDVVEGMSEDEIEVIVRFKVHLDEAREAGEEADWRNYFLPP
jgi:hypothetical protein